MGARKPGPQGERDISVKTIARGMPDDPAEPVVTAASFFCLLAGHGCGQHPAFPAPSAIRGCENDAQLGRDRVARMNGCIPRSFENWIAYCRAERTVLGCFASLAMTASDAGTKAVECGTIPHCDRMHLRRKQNLTSAHAMRGLVSQSGGDRAWNDQSFGGSNAEQVAPRSRRATWPESSTTWRPPIEARARAGPRKGVGPGESS